MLGTRFSQIISSITLFCLYFVEIAWSLSVQTCTKIDSCSCRYDNGTTIDLHNSNRVESGIPIFHYQFPKSSIFIKYSPCRGFSCGQQTQDSSVCIDESFLRHSKDLGRVSSAEFVVSGIDIALIYATNDTTQQMTSRVRLQCSSVEQFVLDTNTSSTYNFTLFTSCACLGGCVRDQSKGEMSVGTVLLLIFFSALILYFGIGCMYQKAVYGGSCAESVPHRQFWFSLPHLIKDGYMFFISPCIGNRAEYRAYDKL